ncbi:ankyrin repeat domain-containing protein [Novosphingobium aquiterrae]|uniref:Ankyrin repeat domain-containing protein n=1 Tax=Novosphingobium aquiterrae TaxID=624388 RepID=A0ABV6PJY9_9SPHN
MTRFSLHPGVTAIAGLMLMLSACVGRPQSAHAPSHAYSPEEIHAAVRNPDPARLSRLLSGGADPDARNAEDGRTPLITALYFENKAQFLMLLRAGAQPGLADQMGNTPLHVAAEINEPWRVLDLLQAGAPPEERNLQGQTFQRYLFMTPDHMLNRSTLAGRQAVLAWLIRHGISAERPVEEASGSSTESAEPEQLRYTIIGTRAGNHLYWRMDRNGKGEVAVPISGGFRLPDAPGSSEEPFRFIEGHHSFDIGAAGYAEIRAQLAGILSSSLNPFTLGNSDLSCLRAMDFGAANLVWSGSNSGNFFHDFACPGARAQFVSRRFDAVWRIIARYMRRLGQSGVIGESRPN